MSKRLVRISAPGFHDALRELPPIMVHAVTRRGNSVFGKIESVQVGGITLTDTRFHQHYFAFTDLYEIVYDKVEA
ncbi:hypothetical protein [Dyadobacter sandarakinus]|uniref:Uncharacterized protein n=1 Tax=Dyadobacter sandarakinus TaxID=2747268 RepID=A0ABX7I7N3_9BACT|nr:hypothetical protein [Dyadobacter sandarakinus]QRR01567.1 hypothetical protein HWI92_11945 [Dyadobacter sandarakinus]